MMNEKTFSRKQVDMSFRKFIDYATDVFNSDNNSFDTHFKILINFCENDQVIRVISVQIKSIDCDFDEWWKQSTRIKSSLAHNGIFELPSDEDEIDALIYNLCLKISNNDINLLDYCIKFFGSSGKTCVQDFNNAIVRKLVRSIENRLTEIENDISYELDDEKQNMPLNFQVNGISILIDLGMVKK
jgi:hypothetical protein